MSKFWIAYLALVTALLSMWAQIQAVLDAPFTEPERSAYPGPVVTPEPPPTWIDACGVIHYGPTPNPWPTAVPVEDLQQVCK